MGKRFGREIRHSDVSQARMSPFEFQVESYLRYQGEKFAQSFNANCYILFTKILDMFDFNIGPGEIELTLIFFGFKLHAKYFVICIKPDFVAP